MNEEKFIFALLELLEHLRSSFLSNFWFNFM